MLRIVDGRKNVGVHIVDRFAFEHRLRETCRDFVAVADSIFPMLKGGSGLGWRFRPRTQRTGKLRGQPAGKAKDYFGEVFFGSRTAGSASQLARVYGIDGLQSEAPLSNKNGARFEFIDQGQQSDGSRLEAESSDVHGQREIFAAVSLAQANAAQLEVNGI